MSEIKHESSECPLVEREISDTTCMEFCEAVDGMLVMAIVDGFDGSREAAQKICYACPRRRYD